MPPSRWLQIIVSPILEEMPSLLLKPVAFGLILKGALKFFVKDFSRMCPSPGKLQDNATGPFSSFSV